MSDRVSWIDRLTGTHIARYALSSRTEGEPPSSLTAAAAVLSPIQTRVDRGYRRERTQQKADADWQAEAWALYDELGALRWPTAWISAAVSRVRLVAARAVNNNDPEILDDGPAAELVTGFGGGIAAQQQFMRRAAQHLFVAGETKFLGRTITDGNGEEYDDWRVCSNTELTQADKIWRYDDGSGPIDLPDDVIIIRAWQPHPTKHYLPDSPVRAALVDLRELRGLKMHVSAQIDSRLAGAGLLKLPDEVTFPAPPSDDPDAPDSLDAGTWYEQVLMEAMLTPIRDRDSAAAVVPILLRGSAEALQAVEHITFSTPLDETAQSLRDEARRSVALSLDVPPEIVLGTGDINHWGAWAVEESAIRISIAPIAAIIAHALTIGWLRPALREMGVADADDHLVWFDTSPLEIRGDRSKAAVELYDRQELSGDALRRENGFDDGDRPTEREQVRSLLLEVARSAPSLLPQILNLLGITGAETIRIVDETPQVPQRRRPEPDTEAEERALPERPDERPEPNLTASAAPKWLLIAADVAMYRALELVGKRLMRPRARRAELGDTLLHEIHVAIPYDRDPNKLLDGAWTSLAPVLPRRLYECLTPRLDAYARRLLNTRSPHTREELERVIAESGCDCDDD